MKKTILMVLLIGIFIPDNYAQTLDVDKFYIVSPETLSNKKEKEINRISETLSRQIGEEARRLGCDLLSRAAYNVSQTELLGEQVEFNPNAKKFIFGRIFHAENGKFINVITHLYDTEGTGLAVLTHNRDTSVGGYISLWERPENSRKTAEAIVRALLEIREEAPVEKKDDFEIPSIPKMERVRCGKGAGVTMLTSGLLMGGAGVYCRIKGKGNYNEYKEIVEGRNGNAEEMLNTARKKNRWGHGLGAAGLAVGTIGTVLLIRCAKKNKAYTFYQPGKRAIERVTFYPVYEYNSISNSNNFQLQMNYNF